jgi:DNA-directed RNA polymerase subunit RPC12/RpoP
LHKIFKQSGGKKMDIGPEKSREKKCPYCGSEKVTPTGGSHVTGTGQPYRPSDQKGYECNNCGKYFHYIGKD